MASRKCTPEQLPQVIQSILNEYVDDITDNIPEIAEKVAKKGVLALKNATKATVKGNKYWKGWTSQTEHGRLSTKVTIYNGRLPGLPHLLEHGHANVDGGRTPGRVHIAPVEEKLVKEFEEKVENELTRSG